VSGKVRYPIPFPSEGPAIPNAAILRGRKW
jgi:hypothetical protein